MSGDSAGGDVPAAMDIHGPPPPADIHWPLVPADIHWPLPPALDTAVRATLDLCQRRGLTVATAESCTGGLIAGALTSVSGSSAVVVGGIVSYANSAKRQLLGVPEEALSQHGAVSAAVAAAMATGARTRLDADLAVAVTGIAGPGGATPGKPVGLVWFGLSDRSAEPRTVQHVFQGDREAVRTATVLEALRLLRAAAEDSDP